MLRFFAYFGLLACVACQQCIPGLRVPVAASLASAIPSTSNDSSFTLVTFWQDTLSTFTVAFPVQFSGALVVASEQLFPPVVVPGFARGLEGLAIDLSSTGAQVRLTFVGRNCGPGDETPRCQHVLLIFSADTGLVSGWKLVGFLETRSDPIFHCGDFVIVYSSARAPVYRVLPGDFPACPTDAQQCDQIFSAVVPDLRTPGIIFGAARGATKLEEVSYMFRPTNYLGIYVENYRSENQIDTIAASIPFSSFVPRAGFVDPVTAGARPRVALVGAFGSQFWLGMQENEDAIGTHLGFDGTHVVLGPPDTGNVVASFGPDKTVRMYSATRATHLMDRLFPMGGAIGDLRLATYWQYFDPYSVAISASSLLLPGTPPGITSNGSLVVSRGAFGVALLPLGASLHKRLREPVPVAQGCYAEYGNLFVATPQYMVFESYILRWTELDQTIPTEKQFLPPSAVADDTSNPHIFSKDGYWLFIITLDQLCLKESLAVYERVDNSTTGGFGFVRREPPNYCSPTPGSTYAAMSANGITAIAHGSALLVYENYFAALRGTYVLDGVMWVAISDNGTVVAASLYDGFFLLDVQTGASVTFATAQRSFAGVSRCALSADGAVVADSLGTASTFVAPVQDLLNSAKFPTASTLVIPIVTSTFFLSPSGTFLVGTYGGDDGFWAVHVSLSTMEYTLVGTGSVTIHYGTIISEDLENGKLRYAGFNSGLMSGGCYNLMELDISDVPSKRPLPVCEPTATETPSHSNTRTTQTVTATPTITLTRSATASTSVSKSTTPDVRSSGAAGPDQKMPIPWTILLAAGGALVVTLAIGIAIVCFRCRRQRRRRRDGH